MIYIYIYLLLSEYILLFLVVFVTAENPGHGETVRRKQQETCFLPPQSFSSTV